MFKNLKRSAIAAAVAVGAMTAATTAEARDGYRGRGDDAAIAIGAGIIGLAIGAAIASDNDHGYYRDGYYYSGPPRYYRSYPRDYYIYYDRYPRRDYRDYREDDRRWDRHWDRGRHRGW